MTTTVLARGPDLLPQPSGRPRPLSPRSLVSQPHKIAGVLLSPRAVPKHGRVRPARMLCPSPQPDWLRSSGRTARRSIAPRPASTPRAASSPPTTPSGTPSSPAARPASPTPSSAISTAWHSLSIRFVTPGDFDQIPGEVIALGGKTSVPFASFIGFGLIRHYFAT